MATASFIEMKDVETTPTEPDKSYEVVNDEIVKAPPLGTYEGFIADDLDRAITPRSAVRSGRLRSALHPRRVAKTQAPT